MNKLLISAVALATVAACSKGPATQTAAEEPTALKSGIDISQLDDSIRPGDDFFAYVNGKWVAETRMPDDRSRYGSFDILRDESQEDVRAIVEEPGSKGNIIWIGTLGGGLDKWNRETGIVEHFRHNPEK